MDFIGSLACFLVLIWSQTENGKNWNVKKTNDTDGSHWICRCKFYSKLVCLFVFDCRSPDIPPQVSPKPVINTPLPPGVKGYVKPMFDFVARNVKELTIMSGEKLEVWTTCDLWGNVLFWGCLSLHYFYLKFLEDVNLFQTCIILFV